MKPISIATQKRDDCRADSQLPRLATPGQQNANRNTQRQNQGAISCAVNQRVTRRCKQSSQSIAAESISPEQVTRSWRHSSKEMSVHFIGRRKYELANQDREHHQDEDHRPNNHQLVSADQIA